MSKKRLRSPPRSADFLSEAFPSSRPLKVQLSALRASQARILTRNLRAAGASVLVDDESSLDSIEPAVIVTDTPPASQEQATESRTARTLFVEPRWAQEVLKKRRCISPTRFALTSPTKAKEEEEVYRRVKMPPVWCEKAGLSATQEERAAWLEKLPSFSVERVSYTDTLYECPNSELVAALRDVSRVRNLLAGSGEGGSVDGSLRGRAYAEAASSIICLPFKLRPSEAAKVHGVGSGLATAIKEFLRTGTLREADLLKNDERIKSLDQLTSMYGIGIRTAQKLWDAGIRSVEEVEKQARNASSAKKGVFKGVHLPPKPYDNISCKEAHDFHDLIAKNWADEGMKFRTCLAGGYRRAKPTGHDVDILFSRDDDGEDKSRLLSVALKVVETRGFIVERLSVEGKGASGNNYGNDSSTPVRKRSYGYPESKTHAKPAASLVHEVLHCTCRFKGRLFRVDFVAVRDAREFAFATLAWSGNVAFQRSLRMYAVRRAGLVFNPHGLFDAGSGVRAECSREARTEHDIFQALGLSYRPPFERNA